MNKCVEQLMPKTSGFSRTTLSTSSPSDRFSQKASMTLISSERLLRQEEAIYSNPRGGQRSVVFPGGVDRTTFIPFPPEVGCTQ